MVEGDATTMPEGGEGVGGGLTVKVKFVVRTSPPPVPVTVTVLLPVGVVEAVLMVKVGR